LHDQCPEKENECVSVEFEPQLFIYFGLNVDKWNAAEVAFFMDDTEKSVPH